MTSAELRRADGPADPPSSRPLAGVLGGQVHAFRFDPAAGVQRVPLPGAFEVAPDAVLHWAFYADGPAAVHAPHEALAVTVDVVFERAAGTPEQRLSEHLRVRDRYGFGLTAEAQFAAAWSMPEQWNADSVSLEPWAGWVARVEVVLGSPALAAASDDDERIVEGFVELVLGTTTDALAPPTASEDDLTAADRVDTRRGSHSGDRFSRGNTIPITAVPHGFCFLTPATQVADTRWPYRWSVHDDARGRPLAALQFSHQPSPWIGDRGVLQLRPFVGAADDAGHEPLRIVPGTEHARPHVYRAGLVGGGRAEMTATSHGGAFRLLADDPRTTVGFAVGSPDGEGRVTIHPDGTFDGWTPEGSADWGNPPRAYFAGRVVGGEAAVELAETGASLVLSAAGGLELRIAQSFLSVEQAGRALAEELPPERGFDSLRDDLRDEWNTLLGAVEIPAIDPEDRPFRGLADDEARAQIASALYRLHLYPNTTAENVGTVGQPRLQFADPTVPAAEHGDDATGAPIADGELFVNNGYWDTYRTAWPALALFDAPRAGRMLDGLLQQAARGGWMARWSAPGYVDSMVGTSSDQIFADAERWGVSFDERAAFETAWRNACEPSDDPRKGRKGIARGRFAGYVSRDVPEGMSWSLENAMSDAGIARLARRLAGFESLTWSPGGPNTRELSDSNADRARYAAYARYFGNRALSYRMLFDPASGFFRGRDRSGRFPDDFDPRVWGGDNVETNAWGMSVSAVHDGAGLAALHGGRAPLRAHLDRLFAEPETGDEAFGGSYGTVIHEQREARAQRSGMCAISNQPAHHIPWMHVHGDRPWQAGALANELAGRLFAGAMIGQGFPGDEDNGEMSMWWLWAAVGLYPLELASGELRLGCPLFDDVTLRRADGSRLRVVSHRSNPDARYLASATLDSAPLENATLSVDALHGDRVLELFFTADPGEAANRGLWDADEHAAEWHPDLTADHGEPLDAAHAALFDDAGAEALAVADAGWAFPAPRTVTDVTLTAGEPAAEGDWLWQASDDGRTWRELATTHREPLPAERTTPFTFAEPVTARMLRVHATARALTLRQIELFDLASPPEFEEADRKE
ncbi:glycoside hydrolase domain-containing protein [Microbacterium sp. NPDC089321]|uniref:glycoside hydrolase domain-containing protein n=1 Tax=Microbacterium sp. NPDC089321 TaxID=3155183 RepID=UPI00342D510C